MQFFTFINEVPSASRSQLFLTTYPITGEPGTSWYLSAPTGGIDTGNITVLFLSVLYRDQRKQLSPDRRKGEDIAMDPHSIQIAMGMTSPTSHALPSPCSAMVTNSNH